MKRKILLVLGLVLAGTLSFLISCSDSNDVSSSNSVKLNIPESCKIIGIKHNEALEAAFQSLRLYYTQQSRSNGEVQRVDKQQCFEIMKSGLNNFLEREGLDFSFLDTALLSGVSRSSGDDLVTSPINKDHILYEYSENLKSVLEGDVKTDSQLLNELNLINNQAAENLSEEDATAVYAGTCTCYYSYQYWKLNYIKWWVALNMPELLCYYSDERINELIIDHISDISPIDPQFSSVEADWIYEEWLRTGETRQMLWNGLTGWWNKGGRTVVYSDAGGAIVGAMQGGGWPGAISEGAKTSILTAIGVYF